MRRFIALVSLIFVLAAVPAVAAAQTPAASPVAGGVSAVRPLGLDANGLALSPDGQWLAGVGPDSTPCFWDVATLTPQCADEDLPILVHTFYPAMAWAPDSSAVVFGLDVIQRAYDGDIYLFERESGALTNLTDDGYEGSLLQAPEDIPLDLVPSWSPDSQQIVFSRSLRSDATGSTSIMRIDRAGGEPVEVVTPDLDEPLTIWMPISWLPDDTILYSVSAVDLDQPLNGVWRVGVDGADPERIIPGDRGAAIPAAMVADVAPATGAISVYSPILLAQFGATWEQPLFWVGSLDDGAVAPIPALDAGTGAPLAATPEPGASDALLAAAPAAFSPDGETALLVYRSVDNRSSLATMDLASGEITLLPPLADGVDLLPTTPQWADHDTVLLSTSGGPAILTIAPAT